MKVKPKKHRLRIFLHNYGTQLNKAVQIIVIIGAVLMVRITGDINWSYMGAGLVYIVSLLKRKK